MPYADVEVRRRYMRERAKRLLREASPAGDKYRRQVAEARRKYKLRDPEELKAQARRWALESRLRRTPEGREAHLEVKNLNSLTRTLDRRGMTLDQYHAKMESQDFACAICRVEFNFSRNGRRQLAHLDHCHQTGLGRGLLCGLCNSGIGHLRESPEFFSRASAYVQHYQKLKAPSSFIPGVA